MAGLPVAGAASTPGAARRGQPEDDLLTAVLDLCRNLHLHTMHIRPARTAKGWATPVQGDGKGWPDLTVVGPGGVLFRELKADGAYPTPEQRAWLGWLDDAGADAAVWRPADLKSGRIVAELQAIRRSTPTPTGGA